MQNGPANFASASSAKNVVAMAPSRDAIATAIGKVIFLRLSKEDSHALFREKLDWAVVQQFTRQALTSTVAASSRLCEDTRICPEPSQPTKGQQGTHKG